MNENKIKRLFPNASRSFIQRNQDQITNTGMPHQPQSMDRKEVCQTQRNKEMGEEYQLCHIDVVFFAKHGKKLDEDNRRYTVKVIQDACCNLGLAQDDSNITSETAQRMDDDHSDI